MTDNMKRWIEALRSGKYSQRLHVYREDGKHCALGVAYELAHEDGAIEWDGDYPVAAGCSGNGGAALVDWLGLRQYLILDDVIFWNDKALLSFDEIASNLESRYGGE